MAPAPARIMRACNHAGVPPRISAGQTSTEQATGGAPAGTMSSTGTALKDDSAKGADPEKGSKYGSGTSTGSSARGSAEFLSDVEGKRAIKASLNTQTSLLLLTFQSFSHSVSAAHEGVFCNALGFLSKAVCMCKCVSVCARACHSVSASISLL